MDRQEWKYNQIMRSWKGKGKEKQFIINHKGAIFSDSDVEEISLPKKRVKNCENQKDVEQYSKIPLVPEIQLTKEDMEGDPISLLLKVESKYEKFGAVKLITPPEWCPPFCFRFGDKGITTRIQHLHKLKIGKSFKQKKEAYTVGNFKAFAKDFQKNYRFKCAPESIDRLEQQENQYWQLVNGKYQGPEWKFKTTVEYAADLPVNNHGSGFPISENRKTKDQNFDYFTNLFNLNNIYKSPLSILKIVDQRREYISGVTTPWVYMGMMFSTFCWHVEDLWLNSINYSHTGSTKTWYIVPKSHKDEFDKYVSMKTGRTDLLNRITFMIDPLQLISHGIPVYKANQNPGEYVFTFYKAYHAGFSHGFNVGEAVNFASPLSFRYIKQAMKQYDSLKDKGPSVMSFEWLVYENQMKKQTFPSYSDIIAREYENMLKNQFHKIEELRTIFKLEGWEQIPSSYKYDRNSCSKCSNYQYLSSIRCKICGKNYCFKDVTKCCLNNFQIVLREPNQERFKILSLLE